MATSLAQQLNLFKSIHKGTPDPIRYPITRPSILFEPKEAADIDLRSVLTISLSGLEALVEIDERFRGYKDTLFSQTSLELDREKMVKEDEEKLNRSISSYLKLLSGHLKHPAAVKTIEYLIRRYQVHVFNVDELILCALPFHDTTNFVRIVQLLNLGNSKWGFLEGVKTSGATLPMKVLVQQCLRDKGVLETLCEYAKLTNEYQHANSVFCFYTSVIGQCMDSIPTVDTDAVRRILPFVFDALNPKMKGNSVHKFCALMVVGLLSTRATLAADLVRDLMFYIARVAQESADLQFIHAAIVAIVGLAQSQPALVIQKRTMTILNDTRDFAGILSSLSRTKNIQKFLCFYFESLIDYSQSDPPTFVPALISMLETLHMNEIVEKVVSKILTRCMKLVKCNDSSNLHKTGDWAKKILVVIDKHYPTELHKAVQKFLENSKFNFRKGDESIFRTFCLMFDEGLESLGAQINTYDSKFWFSLEHPEAKVRIAALSDITSSGILKNISSNPQKHVNAQNAIFRRLHDDDLRVVQAALLVGLAELADPNSLLRVYQEIIVRCAQVMHKSKSTESLPCDVALLCLKHMVMDIPFSNFDYSKEAATIIFPLLVAYPKSLKLNLRALETAKQIKWPYYVSANIGCDSTISEAEKILDSTSITSVNLRTIDALAECLIKDPEQHLPWLVDCSKHSELAKSLFLLIILQASAIYNKDIGTSLRFYQACSKILKEDWLEMENHNEIVLAEEINKDNHDKVCKSCVDQLLSSDLRTLNIKIHICIFWCLLEGCSKSADNHEQLIILDELFLFFTTSPSKNIFKEHLQFLVKNCVRAPFQFLCKYFSEEGFPVEVKVASLDLLKILCSMYGSSERTSMNENGYLQFLLGFPSILIPLCNSNKDIRVAAVSCIEGVYKLWRHFDSSQLKNGSDTTLSNCLSAPTFGEFLETIVSQKLLIFSDANFLPFFLTSMLNKSSSNLLLHENVNKRFDQASKDTILQFILISALNFSLYGKLTVLSAFKGWGSTILDVEGVRNLFFGLLDQRTKCHLRLDKSAQELSVIEIDILCLLLEVCVQTSNSTRVDRDILEHLLEALKVESFSADEPAVVKPCVAVLKNLTCSFYDMLEHDMQDEMFGELVSLFRNDNADIRNAASEAVLRINVSSSTISRHIKLVLDSDQQNYHLKRLKREKGSPHHRRKPNEDLCHNKAPTLQFLGSLLDIILLKKNMEKREDLVQPLFQFLGKLFSKEWIVSLVKQEDQEISLDLDFPESVNSDINHAQQTTLLILQDITDSLLLKASQMVKKELGKEYKIHMLVQCARSAEDVSTRNRVLLLLSSIAKASPVWLSEHMSDIITIVGESALKQIDSHSQSITEELISTLVPCWLSLTKSMRDLLQIFIKALSEVPENRRITLIVYLLRSMGEKENLGVVIFHLFLSLITRTKSSSPNERNTYVKHPFSDLLSGWEYTLSIQVTCQYTCEIWLPCLLQLLEENKLQSDQEEHLLMLYMALQFILHIFKEMYYELDPSKDPEFLQGMLEQIVMQMQFVNVKSKQVSLPRNSLKNIKDCSSEILKTITSEMLPSSYFRSITRLLRHADANVKKKALVLLCETLKDQGQHQKIYKDERKAKRNLAAQFNLDEEAIPFFNELCSQIIQLISCSESETPVKLTALSSIEVLAKEIPTDNSTFTTCLACVVEHIASSDLSISAACLRSTGALVSVLGSKSLPHLSHIMKHILERVHQLSNCLTENPKYSHINASSESSNKKEGILLSVATALESVIDNLGGFLNPYLEDILDVVILHQEYFMDAKLILKAVTVRKLLAEKIPVRLILNPLLKMYTSALQSGDSSLCLVFEMLASVIGVMDKASVGTYHAKIFNHCLEALDIRRQSPALVKNVNVVEQSVINAILLLTMKLTETMFRPLFIHSLEWVDFKFEESESTSVDRTITYHNLINKLVEKHRSLFVPYFKYLLDGCTKHLTEDADIASNPVTHKKKKAKHEDSHGVVKAKGALSPKQWHLRALILKSLHQCFLYDTAEIKFLDASNFQILLKPIVAQIAINPPAPSDNMIDIPSVEEFDEILVLCLGQMAVTARSDVLWKPLNHEVLMQTRSEKIRPKIIGLKVIKYLIEHLKEEYLVFLAETIPFLGELLEDVDLEVKTLAQEILKEMEVLSGENLQQYL